MSFLMCPQCLNEFSEHRGIACDQCQQLFCPDCASQFEVCERCGRGFCLACAISEIQIPSVIAICNECYGDFVEDTDLLFE